MRIIHYSHCNLASAEASTAHVMEFADRLSRMGHDVTVMAAAKGRYGWPTPCAMRYFPYINVKGLRQMTAVAAGFFLLCALHLRRKVHCLYIRRLPLDPMPGVFARFFGVPLIVETNGQVEIHEYEVPLHALWPVLWFPLLLLFERVLFGAAFAVTADGEKRLSTFRNRYPRWTARFKLVLSGGVDLARFRPIDKEEARGACGLAAKRRFLVWVGSIFAWSGLDVLIDAAPDVFARFDDVDILIIGDGRDRGRFEAMAKARGLSGRIKFIGYVPTARLYTWLSASSVALAPYKRLRLDREDFTSYKIFEYLACGLPVVCSFERGESNIGYVQKYNLGATVPPEDPRAFAEAIVAVLNRAEFFTDGFAALARQTLCDARVTWDAVVAQVEALCRQAQESKAGTAQRRAMGDR